MKKYVKPEVVETKEYAEGVYLASGGSTDSFFRSIQMCIVSDHMRQHNSIASSMRKVKLSADGVCNTMAYSKTHSIKCHTCQTGCIVYFFPCD